MLILGIESSCDETSLALLEGEVDASLDFYTQINQFKVKASLISSQIDIHKQYGGVVPEVGARNHAQQVHFLFKELLSQFRKEEWTVDSSSILLDSSDLTILEDLKYIFVTTEPGLMAGLRVGLEFAKTLQFFILQKLGLFVEIFNVNHLQGHVTSCFYKMEQKFEPMQVFPHLHLLVSGGNTQIILFESRKKWQIVGKTLDDAAGECFDKVGRMLGFTYPGGVSVARTAGLEETNILDLPVSMKESPELNFSYSGLKTASRYFLQDAEVKGFKFEHKLSDDEVFKLVSGDVAGDKKLEFVRDFCISVQSVIVQQLINQLKKGIKKYKPITIGVSGGVSANKLLRKRICEIFPQDKVFIPHISLTGDNATMIALAGLALLD